MKLSKKIIFLLTLLFIVNLSVKAKGKKTVGRVLLAKGKVVALRTTKKIPLKRRSNLFIKDVINVSAGSTAQLRMIDHAIISLTEKSRLRIDQYRFNNNRSTDSAIMTLLAGGFRTITGVIGKANKKAYRMKTPLATLGIRGTNYGVVIKGSDNYFAIWSGTINVKSSVSGSTCDMSLGTNQPYRYLKIDQQGNCIPLEEQPDVFAGHSINPKQSASTGSSGNTSTRVSTRSLSPKVSEIPLTTNLKAQTEKPNTTSKVLLSNVQGKIATGIANRSKSKIKIGQTILSTNGKELSQELEQYSVSLGYWNTVSGGNDQGALSWVNYQPTDTAFIATRSGAGHYNKMLASTADGKQANVNVDLRVDFDKGLVKQGAIQVNTQGQQWVGQFGGNIKNGALNLTLNGAYVIDKSKASISNVVGAIQGDFIGKKADAIVGAFNFTEEKNTNNYINGVFVVKETALQK